MPEGHSVHRSANDFNRMFAGEPVLIDSPQGRFSAEAKKISGRRLERARAIGKQLFLDFDNGLTLRVHLGIYGKWRTHPAGEHAAAVGEVRARFASSKANFELRGPTVCEVIDESQVAAIERRLGPDPLNPDPKGKEKARFTEKVLSSKVSIGQLLMSQDVIAGIGNVYRAEILFRAAIEPHAAGNVLTREQVEQIWDDSVKLMKIGVKTSFMITRDELFAKRPTKAERNWVYKREGQPCRLCETKISIELMAGRKLYWCSGCQR